MGKRPRVTFDNARLTDDERTRQIARLLATARLRAVQKRERQQLQDETKAEASSTET